MLAVADSSLLVGWEELAGATLGGAGPAPEGVGLYFIPLRSTPIAILTPVTSIGCVELALGSAGMLGSGR